MKTYTDLEQSKKLAEILPIESADMCYRIVAYNPNDTYEYQPYCFVKTLESDIPCWSLTALLDALPLAVDIHRQVGEDKVCYYVELYMKRMGKEIYLSTDRHKRLVDACYEMILKLHELKLL